MNHAIAPDTHTQPAGCVPREAPGAVGVEGARPGEGREGWTSGLVRADPPGHEHRWSVRARCGLAPRLSVSRHRGGSGEQEEGEWWNLHPTEMPCGQWVLRSEAQESWGRGEGWVHELTRVVCSKGENFGERQGHGRRGRERDQMKLMHCSV